MQHLRRFEHVEDILRFHQMSLLWRTSIMPDHSTVEIRCSWADILGYIRCKLKGTRQHLRGLGHNLIEQISKVFRSRWEDSTGAEEVAGIRVSDQTCQEERRACFHCDSAARKHKTVFTLGVADPKIDGLETRYNVELKL